MGKSLVLKDERNRPSGYVIASGQEVLCRAEIDGAWQLMLLFADGTRQSHKLTGRAEKRLPSGTGELCGGGAICEGCVLLASDEAARITCALHMNRQKTPLPRAAEASALEVSESSKQDNQTQILDRPGVNGVFAQRRWPPPPGWESARYLHGRWQEVVEKSGD